VVDEQAEERAADDSADEEAAETEEVAATKRRGLEVIWHRPKLAQRAAPLSPSMVARKESRLAVVIMAAVLCHRAVVVRGGKVPADARERYHERAAPPKWIDQGPSGPSPTRGGCAGWPGAETFGSRNVSPSVTATITASALQTNGPV
jgi:hypothetical protein